MKNPAVLIWLLLLPSLLWGQTDLDSLKSVWTNSNYEDSERFEAMSKFIWHGYLESQPDSALYYSNLMLEMAREKGSRKYEAMALDNKGNYYWLKGDPDNALELFNQSLEIGIEIDDLAGQAESQLNRGNIYTLRGNTAKALSSYQTCLNLIEGTENRVTQAKALNNIGNIYSNQDQYEKALDYYLRCFNVFEETGEGTQASIPLANMGSIYLRMGEIEMAREFATEALRYAKEFKNVRTMGSSNLLLGSILETEKNYEEALPFFEKSLRYAFEVENREYIAISYNAVGDLKLKMGEVEEAIQNCNKAFEYANEVGLMESEIEACECLYVAYKLSDNTKKSLDFHERFLVLKDSMKKVEIERTLQGMEYDKRHMADSMAMVKRGLEREMEFQFQMAQKDLNTYISYGVGLIILLLAGGLWSRIRWIRRANAELKMLKERAEESEQFEKRFLANMSHEIRTPMNAVLGMTNLTLDTQLDQKQKAYMEAIKASSENLLVIINDILDLSKLEAGKMELVPEAFEIRKLLIQTKQSLQIRADEKGIDFNLEIDENVPDVVVSDKNRINQLLINLLGNALKFTEKGEVKLKVEKKLDPEDCLRFSVSDTGIGISEENLVKLFKAFQQGDSGTQKRFGGTGLGLSISKTLVRLFGGRIHVESELGKGSTFSFGVPLIIASNEQVQNMKKHASMDTSSLKGIRVLLAEDNEYNRIVVHDTLKNLIEGVKITQAANGLETIDKLKKEDFDLILMDVNMPEMDGIKATQKIRKTFRSPKKEIPIIALTASVLAADIDSCMAAGMDAYVPKPFKRIELLQVMKKFYSGKSSDDASMEKPANALEKTESRSNGKVTDLAYLENFCDGNSERIKKYIGLYLDSLPRHLEKIKKAKASSDLLELKSSVHTLKSQMGYMGMKNAQNRASQIEELIQNNGSLDQIDPILSAILEDCEKSIKELS